MLTARDRDWLRAQSSLIEYGTTLSFEGINSQEVLCHRDSDCRSVVSKTYKTYCQATTFTSLSMKVKNCTSCYTLTEPKGIGGQLTKATFVITVVHFVEGFCTNHLQTVAENKTLLHKTEMFRTNKNWVLCCGDQHIFMHVCRFHCMC